MRLWTSPKPFDVDLWNFYRVGEQLMCGGSGEPNRYFRVTGKQFDWDRGRATMRVELELA